MEIGTITLKEALDIFNRRDSKGMFVPFDISFRTFSKTTKKGGQLKVYEGVKWLPSAKPETETTKVIYSPSYKEVVAGLLTPVKENKDPNHFENRTRNIELPNGDIRKINIDFIILVNNYKVIY
jgi:hypothetical protein